MARKSLTLQAGERTSVVGKPGSNKILLSVQTMSIGRFDQASSTSTYQVTPRSMSRAKGWNVSIF